MKKQITEIKEIIEAIIEDSDSMELSLLTENDIIELATGLYDEDLSGTVERH